MFCSPTQTFFQTTLQNLWYTTALFLFKIVSLFPQTLSLLRKYKTTLKMREYWTLELQVWKPRKCPCLEHQSCEKTEHSPSPSVKTWTLVESVKHFLSHHHGPGYLPFSWGQPPAVTPEAASQNDQIPYKQNIAIVHLLTSPLYHR